MTPSPLQQAIFSFIQKESGSLSILATAGSGKTTTIVQAARLAPGGSKFMAFNKSIAGELEARLPFHVESSTFHSHFYAQLRRAIRTGRPSKWKTHDIIKENFPHLHPYRMDFTRLISLGKSAGIGLPGFPPIKSKPAWEELIDHHDLDIPHDLTFDEFIEGGQAILTRSNESPRIDFDDMIYLPLLLSIQLEQIPTIFIDEAQDLSPLQHELLAQSTSRLIAVGDPHQAIYGFRGAESNSMDLLTKRFSATTLPLSVTYRCARAIVDLARRYDPTITARPDAPLGSTEPAPSLPPVSSSDLILSRLNRPLVAQALAFLRAREPFNLQSDFPQRLLSQIKQLKAKSLTGLEDELTEYYLKKIEHAESRGRKGAAASHTDTLNTLCDLISTEDTVQGLLATITQLSTSQGGPTLATIHKAKGLEARRAFLLRPETIPAPFATQGWMLQQEENAHYVAITRAKEHFCPIQKEEEIH